MLAGKFVDGSVIPRISFSKYVDIDLGSASPVKKTRGCSCKRGCNKECYLWIIVTIGCHYIIRIIWVIA
jgi:hypothetical protein